MKKILSHNSGVLNVLAVVLIFGITLLAFDYSYNNVDPFNKVEFRKPTGDILNESGEVRGFWDILYDYTFGVVLTPLTGIFDPLIELMVLFYQVLSLDLSVLNALEGFALFIKIPYWFIMGYGVIKLIPFVG